MVWCKQSCRRRIGTFADGQLRFPKNLGEPCSLLGGRVRRRGLELVTRYSSRKLPRRRQDLPSSWGTPIVRLHMFQSDAGRTACTRPYSAAAWPLVIERQRLPRLGLSALNSMAFGLAVYASPRSLPARRKTRFQLLVKLYWTGFSPERFR